MSDLFDSTSPRFGLPLLFAGQAQKEVFVNEAHALADMLLHCAIEGESAAPPASPAEGEAWLVAASPTGSWAGHAGKLAGWQGGNWLFASPRDGMRVLDLSTGQDRRYSGGEWLGPDTPALPSGGAVIDSEARAAIAAIVAALQQAGIFAEG